MPLTTTKEMDFAFRLTYQKEDMANQYVYKINVEGEGALTLRQYRTGGYYKDID